MKTDIAALFRKITQGVYVVGVAHGERRHAFTAVWVTQVSFDPLLLAVSVNPANASYPLLRASGGFTVSVLKQGQLEFARHFGTRSGRDVEKLAGFAWRPGITGAPILQDAAAYFDCRVVGSMPAGDHELLVGQAVNGEILDPDAHLMSYAETGALDGSWALYPTRF